MISSLSNDRKAVLKSAVTGSFLILLLSCAALLEALWFFCIIGVIAVYWIIPIRFSWSRQLIKKEVKSFAAIDLEKKNIEIAYQYFNTDGKEVTPCSAKEKFLCFLFSIVITFTLISYPPLSYLEDYFPNYSSLILVSSAFLFFSAAYLIRHGLYFYKDLPLDTSFTDNFSASSPSNPNKSIHSNSSSNCTSLDHFTSGRYSYLPYNINNHRKY